MKMNGWCVALVVVVAMVTGCGPREPENQAPEARLRTPVVADATRPVLLDAKNSADPEGALVSYRYLLGDGTPEVVLTEATYRHVFPGPGQFTVRLTVEDNTGATAQVEQAVVLVNNYAPPYCLVDTDCAAGQTCESPGICWQETASEQAP